MKLTGHARIEVLNETEEASEEKERKIMQAGPESS